MSGNPDRHVKLRALEFQGAVRFDGQIDGVWLGPDGLREDGAVLIRQGDDLEAGVLVLPLRLVLGFWVPLSPEGIFTHRFSTGIHRGGPWTFQTRVRSFLAEFVDPIPALSVVDAFGQSAATRVGQRACCQMRFVELGERH